MLNSHKTNATIIIFGFSISIAVVISLVFFILQEKSYDRSFKNVDNIYMVVTTQNESFVEEDAKEILVNKYPQIESACRYYNYTTNFIFNQGFLKGQMITTDEGFFDVFSLEFIYGSKKTAFSIIQGIVLTESYAKKIFDKVLPIGQTIKTIGGKIFQVTGVVKDLPENSSIIADCFIHYKSKIYFSAQNNVYTTKLFIAVNSETKIKEFGIRKINGAKTSEILSMINSEFIWWILIAFVIACPISIYILHRWLNNFAYKTVLNWWIFAFAGIVTLLFVVAIVTLQSWKTAQRNPAEALKDE